MADSGARGSAQQIRQLAGMRGLMAKPSGEIIETPITTNFREGLSVLQYFISTHGARKGLADTALKTANSGYLTRRLVDVAQDCVIAEYDCGTMDGIETAALVEGGEIIEKLGDRILGRVPSEDIFDPYTGEVLVQANEEITEDKVRIVEDAGIDKLKIRSVLTCETRRGICVLCYGRDLARGHMVNIGEAVGVIAAQSIGEPGTQLTMRTFHIGGVGQVRTEQSQLEARYDGTVKLENVELVKREKHYIVMNRHGEIVIQDETGRERERYGLTYGAKLYFADGDKVKQGQLLSEWDPFSVPILTEVPGVVKFGDVIEGVTMTEQLDEVTGLSPQVHHGVQGRRPAPAHLAEGRPRRHPAHPQHATRKPATSCRWARPSPWPKATTWRPATSSPVSPARPPRPRTSPAVCPAWPSCSRPASRRSTRSSPRSTARSASARTPRASARSSSRPDKGEPREYLISKGKHLSVREGDKVQAGEPLMDGAANPHDILRVLGEKELAKYLVDGVQEVYRLQGVKINDKHIETIVRQMLRRVRVSDVGDTSFLVDEHVEKYIFEEENERVIARNGRPGQGEPLLLGITKASLSTESFISASSFQETTKVLTEAAVCGKVDYLRGLKENVIMGRLIPAGTGLGAYKRLSVKVEDAGEDAARGAPATAAATAVAQQSAAHGRRRGRVTANLEAIRAQRRMR